MILTFTHGYPHPSQATTEAESEAESLAAAGHQFIIRGVASIQMLYTTTVQFQGRHQFEHAKTQTGWKVWDDHRMVLEVPASADDGYDQHPAHIIKGMAYCGMILGEDR